MAADTTRSDLSPSLDIGADRVAKVYAQAVVEAADAAGCRRDVLDELAALVRDVLPQVPRAREVFSSPRIDVAEKEALIDRVAGGRMQPTTVRALHVLARHGRLGILAEVSAAAERLADQLDGRHQATITTAIPLADEERSQLAGSVEQSLGLRLSPTFAVDPRLIGGLIVRVGDTIYDRSIATGLTRLGDNLHRRTNHEVQHGRDRLTSA
jgi:F-type H+-transporting ATPase subunit delta